MPNEELRGFLYGALRDKLRDLDRLINTELPLSRRNTSQMVVVDVLDAISNEANLLSVAADSLADSARDDAERLSNLRFFGDKQARNQSSKR